MNRYVHIFQSYRTEINIFSFNFKTYFEAKHIVRKIDR